MPVEGEISEINVVIEDDEKTGDKSDTSVAEEKSDNNYVFLVRTIPKLQVSPNTSSTKRHDLLFQ